MKTRAEGLWVELLRFEFKHAKAPVRVFGIAHRGH